MITHVPISTKKIHPITTIKSIRNLTHTPFTPDLSDYFDSLDEKYGINTGTNSYQSITKAPGSNKNSKGIKFKKKSIHLFESVFTKGYSPCLSAPCLHNSTCVIQSEHSFQCLCSSSFIGIYCEIGKFVYLFRNI